MAKQSKRYRSGAEKIDREKRYPLAEAIALAIGGQRAKFDETVEMAIRLNVDPRQADQNVRGTVVLPNGIGKSQRVLVFAKGEKAKEAEAAGADFVGAEDMVKILLQTVETHRRGIGAGTGFNSGGNRLELIVQLIAALALRPAGAPARGVDRRQPDL